MDKKQYQELKYLVEIFDESYFNGEDFDNEKVECFELIKKIVDNGCDTKNIPQNDKDKMQKQLIEAFDFIESINGMIEYKDKFLSYFCAADE